MNDAFELQGSSDRELDHGREASGISKNVAVRKACNECRQQKVYRSTSLSTSLIGKALLTYSSQLRCNAVKDPFTPCSRCVRLQIECCFDINFKRIEKRK